MSVLCEEKKQEELKLMAAAGDALIIQGNLVGAEAKFIEIGKKESLFIEKSSQKSLYTFAHNSLPIKAKRNLLVQNNTTAFQLRQWLCPI